MLGPVVVWIPPQVLRHQSWGLVSWGVREAARLQEAPKSKRILACRQNQESKRPLFCSTGVGGLRETHKMGQEHQSGLLSA